MIRISRVELLIFFNPLIGLFYSLLKTIKQVKYIKYYIIAISLISSIVPLEIGDSQRIYGIYKTLKLIDFKESYAFILQTYTQNSYFASLYYYILYIFQKLGLQYFQIVVINVFFCGLFWYKTLKNITKGYMLPPIIFLMCLDIHNYITGLRYPLAISIYAYSLYQLIYNKKIRCYIFLSIVSLGIHTAVISLILITLLSISLKRLYKLIIKVKILILGLSFFSEIIIKFIINILIRYFNNSIILRKVEGFTACYYGNYKIYYSELLKNKLSWYIPIAVILGLSIYIYIATKKFSSKIKNESDLIFYNLILNLGTFCILMLKFPTINLRYFKFFIPLSIILILKLNLKKHILKSDLFFLKIIVTNLFFYWSISILIIFYTILKFNTINLKNSIQVLYQPAILYILPLDKYNYSDKFLEKNLKIKKAGEEINLKIKKHLLKEKQKHIKKTGRSL